MNNNNNDQRIMELSNGIRIANFSSPHSFKFTDGNILPAVALEDTKRLELSVVEQKTVDRRRIDTVVLRYFFTSAVRDEIRYWQKLYNNNEVDIVIIPLPVLNVMKSEEDYTNLDLLNSPFRVVRLVDRVQKLVSINKFCV